MFDLPERLPNMKRNRQSMDAEARDILANAIAPLHLSEQRLDEIRSQIAMLREPGMPSLSRELIAERRAEAKTD